MARNKGIFDFAANLEGRVAAPIDAKMKVDLKNDLVNPAIWESNQGDIWTYTGMIVSVALDSSENNGIYRLVTSDYTNIDNWEKIGDSSDITNLKEYIDSSLEDRDSSITDLYDFKLDNTTDTFTGILNIDGSVIIEDDINIGGNLTVNGSTYLIGVETIDVSSKYIHLNTGLSGAPPTTMQSGIVVGRGDLEPYAILYDETGKTFRIGIAEETSTGYLDSSTQAVATREDSPYNGAVAFWNASDNRFDTSSGFLAENLYINGNDGNILLSNGVGGTKTDSNFAWNGTTLALEADSGTNNVFIGKDVGSSNTTGNYNVFLGYETGLSNTEGTQNVFSGYQTGMSNTTGRNNVFNGSYSGYYNTEGGYNVFNGSYSGFSNTTGSNNVFNGFYSGRSNTTGNYNVFNGYSSGRSNTTGSNNVFNGSYSGRLNTTGSGNVFNGSYSGYLNTEGEYNVFYGSYSGYNTTGVGNVFLGYQSGYNETGSNKLYIENSNADSSSALIYGEFDNKLLRINASTFELPLINKSSTNKVLFYNETTGEVTYADSSVAGSDMYIDGSNNEIIVSDGTGGTKTDSKFTWDNSTLSILDGNNNLLINYKGTNITTAINNILIGDDVGKNIWEGSRNVYIGDESGYYNRSGNDNILIGYKSGYGRFLNDNIESVVIGSEAGGQYHLSRSVLLGYRTGYNATTSISNSIIIGYKAGSTDSLISNKLIIENSDTSISNALIYGEFDNKILRINASTFELPLINESSTNKVLFYNETTGGISYGDSSTISSGSGTGEQIFFSGTIQPSASENIIIMDDIDSLEFSEIKIFYRHDPSIYYNSTSIVLPDTSIIDNQYTIRSGDPEDYTVEYNNDSSILSMIFTASSSTVGSGSLIIRGINFDKVS